MMDIDPLHPNGKCRCAGQGECEWCVRTAKAEAREEAQRGSELPPGCMVQEGEEGWPDCVLGYKGLWQWVSFPTYEEAEEFAWAAVGGREEWTRLQGVDAELAASGEFSDEWQARAELAESRYKGCVETNHSIIAERADLRDKLSKAEAALAEARAVIRSAWAQYENAGIGSEYDGRSGNELLDKLGSYLDFQAAMLPREAT